MLHRFSAQNFRFLPAVYYFFDKKYKSKDIGAKFKLSNNVLTKMRECYDGLAEPALRKVPSKYKRAKYIVMASEIIEVYRKNQSQRETAQILNIHKDTVAKSLRNYYNED